MKNPCRLFKFMAVEESSEVSESINANATFGNYDFNVAYNGYSFISSKGKQ